MRQNIKIAASPPGAAVSFNLLRALLGKKRVKNFKEATLLLFMRCQYRLEIYVYQTQDCQIPAFHFVIE